MSDHHHDHPHADTYGEWDTVTVPLGPPPERSATWEQCFGHQPPEGIGFVIRLCNLCYCVVPDEHTQQHADWHDHAA